MSFNRAERFDKIPAQTPAPGSYDPKFPDKVIGGGLVTKSDRLVKTTSKNAGALKKPPSSPLLFRVPAAPRDKGIFLKTHKQTDVATFGSVDNLRVNENLESLTARNIQLASQLATLEESKSIISHERDDAFANLKELQEECAKLAKNTEELQEKVIELETSKDTNNETISHLKNEKKEIQLAAISEKRQVQIDIENITYELLAMHDSHGRLSRNHEELLVSNMEYQLTIVEMQDQIDMMETELNASTITSDNKIKKLKEELETSENAFRRLQIAYSNMFNALNVLKERLMNTTSDTHGQDDLLKETMIINANLEEKVVKMDKLLEELMSKNVKDIKDLESNLLNDVDSLKKHAAEEVALRFEITNNVVSQVEDLTQEKEVLAKELLEIRKMQTVLQENLRHKLTELDETKFELLCTTDKLTVVSSKLEKTNEQTSQLEKIQAEVEAKDKVIKKLKKQLSSGNIGDGQPNNKSRSKSALGKENTVDNSPIRNQSPAGGKKPFALNVSAHNLAKLQ